jgi:hypothetical protein
MSTRAVGLAAEAYAAVKAAKYADQWKQRAEPTVAVHACCVEADDVSAQELRPHPSRGSAEVADVAARQVQGRPRRLCTWSRTAIDVFYADTRTYVHV